MIFIDIYVSRQALFRNRRFMFGEKLQKNTSKSAIFLEYENPCRFFSFFISCYFTFSLINALIYVYIDHKRFVVQVQSPSLQYFFQNAHTYIPNTRYICIVWQKSGRDVLPTKLNLRYYTYVLSIPVY